MKKFLAALLAVLMLFSASCITVFAEEETTEPATEPEVTINEYEISEDPDFSTVTYLAAGNDSATILKEGDTIVTYKSKALKILYYPDADAVNVSGSKWVASDKNNLAFSISGKEYFSEANSGKKKPYTATIEGIDYTDFTIAYSEENTFVGWVIYEFNATANEIKVAAVWEKNRKVAVEDDSEDFDYIVDKTFSIWKAIFKPFTAVINFISNGFLYIGNFFYELIFGTKPAA
ncbi:MAG: hypothetical protein IJB86_06300 [Clostridia bacterium]|nr:hypothetical protein [Clostridia bacterium]